MKQITILIAFVLLISFTIKAQSNNQKEMKIKPLLVYENNIKTNTNMSKIAVWDTYVTKKDGTVMHFDILAPEEVKDTTIIYEYGKEYLITKGQDGQSLSAKECSFCHVETLRPNWEADIKKQGYFIIEMENCN